MDAVLTMHKATMQVQRGCTPTHHKATSWVLSQVRGEADKQILRDRIMLFIMPLPSTGSGVKTSLRRTYWDILGRTEGIHLF